jgi:DNA-binding HxlR family transcriptional regulator
VCKLAFVKELSYLGPMQRTSFSDFACSVAKTLDVVGEWWTPLILRDVFLGVTKFDLIQQDLGIPRKVLAERLSVLIDNDVLSRHAYRDGRTRYEYQLTDKGNDFITALIAMMNWGDRWLSEPNGPPLHVLHSGCGGAVEAQLVCLNCGDTVVHDGLHTESGAGARATRGTAIVSRRARLEEPSLKLANDGLLTPQ